MPPTDANPRVSPAAEAAGRFLGVVVLVVSLALVLWCVPWLYSHRIVCGLKGDRVKLRVTRYQMDKLKFAIQDYVGATGQLPAVIELLIGRCEVTKSSLRDGWNTPFVLTASADSSGLPWRIVSAGPDGQLGTNDDIVSPELPPSGEPNARLHPTR